MAAPIVVIRGDGAVVDYTPGSAVAAGDVIVQVDLVGVAAKAIAANALGALQVSGPMLAPKATGSGTALPAGTIVYWDVAEEVVKASSESGANKQFGKVITAALAADATVEVLKTV